jgi:hypothetical protein
MPRTVLVRLFTVAVMAGLSPEESNAGCLETYKNYMEALRERNISPEERNGLHRWAQRAYNACETGHVPDIGGLFERLDRQRL